MALQVIKGVTKKYPITRGMMVYSMLWPVANVTEQVLSGKEYLDIGQMTRFTMFGTFFVAPTLYGWVLISGKLIPGRRSLLTGMKKALIEQLTYGPFANTTFLVGMALLEGRSFDMACAEWKQKFLPTWKTAICYWPIVQTINFAYIPERNRVVFTSIFSFLWTCFLSYVKHHDRVDHKVKVTKSMES